MRNYNEDCVYPMRARYSDVNAKVLALLLLERFERELSATSIQWSARIIVEMKNNRS